MTIEADHYRQEVALLKADPIVRQMAKDCEGAWDEEKSRRFICHPDNHPTFEFMSTANAEYRERGGTQARTIGGVGRAIVSLLLEGSGDEAA